MNVPNSSYLRVITARAVTVTMACAICISTAFAGVDTGADFLKIPIGAEPAGLGQAYTASAHGINALNWNPAGIVKSPSEMGAPTLGISFSHQNEFEENNLDHLGLVGPMGKENRSSWGLDMIRLSYADQEARDENRRVVGSVSASDMAFGAAYAHNFGRLQAGTQLKLIRMELAGKTADGIAADVGFLMQTGSPHLSLGLAARNIGPSMRFVQEKFNLPLTLSAGAAFRLTNPLTVALDVHLKPHQKQTVVSLGTELNASRNISLRAGYLAKLAEAVNNGQKSESNRGNLGGIAGLAGGFGLVYERFSLDYAITPFGELGNTQMLTLSTWFGNASNSAPNFFTPPTGSDTDENTAPPANDRTILILPVSNGSSWWQGAPSSNNQP